jgi:hypothetical protein
MSKYVVRIGEWYGFDSTFYAKASESLSLVLVRLLELGGHVMRDGDLDLICKNDFITYGVNFHRIRTDDDMIGDIIPGTWSINS